MIKDGIIGQKNFSEEFQKKADLSDILFLIACLVIPYFTKQIFLSVVLFSYLGLWYMRLTIKGFPYKCLINSEQTKTDT